LLTQQQSCVVLNNGQALTDADRARIVDRMAAAAKAGQKFNLVHKMVNTRLLT